MVTNTEPGAMTQTVEAMLDELHPLTGERAVLAQMARQLAATLDGMEASVAARMAGQTHGQLLKVLDKLGAQRREVGPTVDAAPPPSTPPTPSKPYTDEHWYPGFEDNLYAESWRRSSGSMRSGPDCLCRAPWRTPETHRR